MILHIFLSAVPVLLNIAQSASWKTLLSVEIRICCSLLAHPLSLRELSMVLKSVPGLSGWAALGGTVFLLALLGVCSFTKRDQINCKVSSSCTEVVSSFPLRGERRKLRSCFCARLPVPQFPWQQRGNGSQAFTYKGIKAHPLGEQTMIPGEPWKLESVGFDSSSHIVWGSRREKGWEALREGWF